MIKVDVWSDYNCPWCFLASTSLKALRETYGVEVTWHSYELRPKGSPPMPESYKQRIAQMRPQMEHMARVQYGVAINQGRFGVDSRPALIGAKFAEQQGLGNAYHDAVMSAYWEQAQDIEDTHVLADIAASVGLDRNAFIAGLADRDLEVLVDTDILTARQLDITGVPAILFNNKYLVPGAQPYTELVRVMDYVRQREGLL